MSVVAPPVPYPDYLDEAFALIVQVEGVRLKPYQDSTGVWTIGIGCIRMFGKPVSANTPAITMSQAREACHTEMGKFDSVIASAVQVPLNVGQRAALLSFTYNLGEANLLKSGLLRLLNQGKYAEAADEFPKWNMAGGKVVPGLVRRRALERAVFLGKVSPSNSISSLQLPAHAPTNTQVVSEESESDKLNDEQLRKNTT